MNNIGSGSSYLMWLSMDENNKANNKTEYSHDHYHYSVHSMQFYSFVVKAHTS